MKIETTFCEGLHLLRLNAIQDERGCFARLFCEQSFMALGLNPSFPQTNHSSCRQRGVLRGLHYQKAPRAEIKLIRCVQGAILDVAVDVRRGSPTFLQWFATELSADRPEELYVGAGFAHGYMALTDDASVVYHSSQPYTPELEGRVHYGDPRIGIEWPVFPPSVSPKDASTPFLEDDFEGIEPG
jgi:dTDP-4-dehydrorhamnose 3,5-epimerase